MSGSSTSGVKRSHAELDTNEDDAMISSSSASSSSASSSAVVAAGRTGNTETSSTTSSSRSSADDGHVLGLADLAHGITMSIIFSYCDAKALYRLACLTSKDLSQFVTLKHVVFSAVSSGGNARESLDRVVRLMKKRMIYTPSKFRLLRLMNGHQCERGVDCVQNAWLCAAAPDGKVAATAAAGAADGKVAAATAATDIDAKQDQQQLQLPQKQQQQQQQQKKKKARGVNLARKDFGLFVCSECTAAWHAHRLPKDSSVQHGTAKLGRSRNSWFLKNERLAVRDQNSSFSPIVWREPFVDASGEKAGPVLTHADYLAAMESEAAVENALKAVDEEDAEARGTASEIIAYQKEVLEESQKRKQAIANATEEKRLKVYTKRVEQFKDGVIKTLQERLKGVPWRDIALAYDIRGNGGTYVRTERVATFKCPITQGILSEFTVTPNKFDRITMNAMAAELMESFNLMWSVGFHDFSFLDAAAEAGDRLSKDLRAYYSGRLTPTEIMQHDRMHPEVLGLIRSGHCLEALYRRFQSRESIYLAASQYKIPRNSAKKKKKKRDDASAPIDPFWFTRVWENLEVTEHDTTMFFYSALMSRDPLLGHVSHDNAVVIAKETARTGDWNQPLRQATGKGFEKLWKEAYMAGIEKFDSRLAVARAYCADVMAGDYGEKDGESDAHRARRKEILCGAVTSIYLLDDELAGKGFFEEFYDSVSWSLSALDGNDEF